MDIHHPISVYNHSWDETVLSGIITQHHYKDLPVLFAANIAVSSRYTWTEDSPQTSLWICLLPTLWTTKSKSYCHTNSDHYVEHHVAINAAPLLITSKYFLQVLSISLQASSKMLLWSLADVIINLLRVFLALSAFFII